MSLRLEFLILAFYHVCFVSALLMLIIIYQTYFGSLLQDDTIAWSSFSHSTFAVERSMFNVQFLKVLFNSFKTTAMDRAETKFSNGILMGPGRVSFVFGKIELRIVMMVILHQAIPGNLGNN